MAKFKVSIYGVDQLIKRFEAAPQKMYNQSKEIIDEAVNDMATKAYQKASNLPIINPNSKYKRTGNLAKSIRQTKYTAEKGASISAGNGNVKYAAFVEFGTGKGYGLGMGTISLPISFGGSVGRNVMGLFDLFKMSF